MSSVAASSPVESPRGGPNPRVAVALLLLINLMNYVDRYVLAAVVPKLREEFFPGQGSKADGELGWLAFAFMISYMVASPLFGWMADRMSRWWIVAGGVIVWSLASGASGLAQTFTMLLVTRIFVGIGEAAYGPAAPTIISDLYPVERRGRVLSWFYMAIPVGSALGYTFGGLMADHSHWRWAFYLSVIPGILLGLCALTMRDPRRGHGDGGGAKAEPPRTTRLADYMTFLKTPSYVFNTLGMTMMTFALGGISYWMPDYVHRFRKAGDLGAVSFTFGAITAVAGLTATLSGGYLGDRLRKRWSGSYFLVSGIGMLLGWPLFIAMLITPFPYAWGLIFLAEFCLFFNTGPANTVLANVVHPSVRASAFAVNIFVIHALGDAISPWLIGQVNAHYDGNMNYGFAVVSGAILLSGIFWILGAKHLERDTALAETRIAA